MQKGMTVDEIVAQIGISKTKYYLIESGEQTATEEVAEKISKVLGIQKDIIFLPQKFTVRETEFQGR